MDIILQGQHEGCEALASLERVLQLFKEKYHIQGFREIHLNVTLINDEGDEVELVDTDTNKPYRVFKVLNDCYELNEHKKIPLLRLVVDNTK